MPGIFHKPVDRRKFLKVSALGGAALGLSGCQSTPNYVSSGKLRMALLSDTHTPGDRTNIYRGFHPWENLQKVAEQVAEIRPEGVIINGDAARLEGLPEDYRELRDGLERIASIAPVYIGLGNHDERANFNKTFPKLQHVRAEVADKNILVLDQGFMRILVLDSLLYTNKTAGLLGRKQRTWLTEYLTTRANLPVVIFVHHTLGEEDGELLDARRLFEIAERHPQVKAIFYGHSHVWDIKAQGKLQLVNLPAVGYNFKDTEPVGWVDATFDSKGVDLMLRTIDGKHPDERKLRRVNWS